MKHQCKDCSSGLSESPESAYCKCGDSSIMSPSETGPEKLPESQEEDKVIQGIFLNLNDAISHSSHSPRVWAKIIERTIEMLKDEKVEMDPDAHSLAETQAALTDMIKEYQAKHTIGRPTIFTVELAMKILARIEEGESLYAICKDPDMPSKGAVLRWVFQHEAFGAAYRRARLQQAHLLADGALEAAEEADDTSKLKLQKARIVFQSRLALAEKYNPAEFGGKVSIQGVVGHLTHEETVRMLEEREAKEAKPIEINTNPLSLIKPHSVIVPHSES